MKKTFLSFVMLFGIIGTIAAQNPTLEYLKTLETDAGNDLQIRAANSAVDNFGNLVVVGSFRGSVDIDPSGMSQILTSTGPGAFSGDMFVAKYNPNGDLLWGFAVGDDGAVYPTGLSIDSSNNIIVSGKFRFSVDFDPGIGVAQAYGSPITDGFIVKYNANGNYLWKNHVYNSGHLALVDHVTRPAADILNNGNTVVAGAFKDVVSFTNVNGQTVILNTNTPGMFDGYIAEMNSSGNWIRVQKIGYSGVDVKINTIDYDSNFDLIIGLTLSSQSSFYKSVLTRYFSDWSHSDLLTLSPVSAFPDPIFNLRDVVVDTNDDDKIYLSGEFKGGIADDNNTTLINNNSNYYDGFLLKSNRDGDIQWAKHIAAVSNGARFFKAAKMAVKNEKIFMSGIIRGTYDILNQNGQSQTITNSGTALISCLVKYRSDGTIVWDNVFESNFSNDIVGINLYGPQFYLFGTFDGLTEFNPDPNQSTQVDVANSIRDYFIGKFTDSPSPNPFLKILEINDTTFNSKDLIIYPVNAKVYEINYSMIANLGDISYRIFNTLGQEITNGKMLVDDSGYKTTVDLNTASNGVYFVELSNESHKVTKRFLVK